MRRIVVIGNAGGGKTTLSRRLAAALDLPHHSIDAIWYLQGWQAGPAEDFAARHDALIADERWIIDGWGPDEQVIQRLAAADCVLLVDLPLWRHLWWAAKRQLIRICGGQVPAPDGCDYLGVYWSMIAMMWRIDRDSLPRLRAQLSQFGDGRRVLRLRSAREIEDFLRAHSDLDS